MRFALAAILAASCGSKPKHEFRTYQVEIRGMQFVPATLKLEVGDIVMWTNQDIVPHTVTAAGWFDSGPLLPHQQWSYVAERPIEYDYVCTFHPTMKGRIVAATVISTK